MEHNQINILYCLTLDFLTVSGNTITLLEPPEDDPVSTLYSNHRVGMSCKILIQVLSIHVCKWQGEGTSAVAECTSADEETVTGFVKAWGMSILWKYPAYLVHKVWSQWCGANRKYMYVCKAPGERELADAKNKLKKRKLQEKELELEIKRWTLRKLDPEIQKLEREVSISVHTVTITAIQCFDLCCFCSLYSRIQATKRNDCYKSISS